MAKLVTTTYAQALFQLAVEEGKVDELFSQVEALIAILDENPDLARIMRHPGVDKNEMPTEALASAYFSIRLWSITVMRKSTESLQAS